uniref:Uncharacterized protein n=1 Tax=Arundo donax TaxID=35708 RepID=A0A0A9T4X0_ARUDO
MTLLREVHMCTCLHLHVLFGIVSVEAFFCEPSSQRRLNICRREVGWQQR